MTLNDGEKHGSNLGEHMGKSHLNLSDSDIFATISNNRDNLNNDLLQVEVVGANKRGMLILDVLGGNKYPHLDQEIFKLIENTFKTIGGATGLGIKTDKYNDKFHQLLVIKLGKDISNLKLLSGYRYYQRPNDKKDIDTPMSNMFDIKEDSMLLDPNVKVLELGTAWSSSVLDRMESLLSFSGTWNGLAALTKEYNENDLFIGKMTIPANYNKRATVFAMKYLEKAASKEFCGVSAKDKVEINSLLDSNVEFQKIEKDLLGLSGDYKQDNKQIKEILQQDYYGTVNDLPAMFPLYLSRLKQGEFYYIDTVINGNVLESGIVVSMKSLDDGVRETYSKDLINSESGISLGEYIEMKNK